MAQQTSHGISNEMQQCIDECTRCHDTCVAMVNHCLERGGRHAAPAHITLLLDCAEICQTSANFMLRGSERHHLTCRACAEICRACAEDCERLGQSDEMMQECAEECRRCQHSCERMAA